MLFTAKDFDISVEKQEKEKKKKDILDKGYTEAEDSK